MRSKMCLNFQIIYAEKILFCNNLFFSFYHETLKYVSYHLQLKNQEA
jgi:hypothetical protein